MGGFRICHCEEAKGRRGDPDRGGCQNGQGHRRPCVLTDLTVAALSERHGQLQVLRHSADRTRLVGERHAAPGGVLPIRTGCR